jgi:SAM-dependent methyltransferase
LGYLTNALRRCGYRCDGVDISQTAVDRATKRFGPWYRRLDVTSPADAAERYDIAMLLETIEHVVDPVAFVRGVRGLLAPGGSVVLTTPNRDAHPSGARWRTDLPPVHLFWFGERSVERLAQEVGMNVEFVDFTEFNGTHRQSVLTSADGRPESPWLDRQLRASRPVALRHRVMERARNQSPVLAQAAHAVLECVRPGRERLTRRSFSLAAVLTTEQ